MQCERQYVFWVYLTWSKRQKTKRKRWLNQKNLPVKTSQKRKSRGNQKSCNTSMVWSVTVQSLKLSSFEPSLYLDGWPSRPHWKLLKMWLKPAVLCYGLCHMSIQEVHRCYPTCKKAELCAVMSMWQVHIKEHVVHQNMPNHHTSICNELSVWVNAALKG